MEHRALVRPKCVAGLTVLTRAVEYGGPSWHGTTIAVMLAGLAASDGCRWLISSAVLPDATWSLCFVLAVYRVRFLSILIRLQDRLFPLPASSLSPFGIGRRCDALSSSHHTCSSDPTLICYLRDECAVQSTCRETRTHSLAQQRLLAIGGTSWTTPQTLTKWPAAA